jgi:2-polyprenyl-3-methyl-5-hydroxy-6-metoxy-1,4-benzoquinol methylase
MNIKKKLLILIVAYNHEKFIKSVLQRINTDLAKKYDVEILINDDCSSDKTVEYAQEFIRFNTHNLFKYKMLSNPENQGYGGNQKIGYEYAIKNNFDFVALVHGDGQYAPEYLQELVEPLNLETVDAVFGSRMMTKNGALKGGMPLYKFVGNKILTFFQNSLFSTKFTEFHSGYRIYKISSLKKIPYVLNTNDYSFDNEIIAQFLLAKLTIKELPIPTYYGDEISYVNGLKYAYQVFTTNIKAKLQEIGIFYDRKFDCAKELKKENYVIKDSFHSTHSITLDIIKENSTVLDLGCNKGELGSHLKKKNCHIVGIDKEKKLEKNELDEYISFDLNEGLPNIDYKNFNYIIVLDVIEHLMSPEKFMHALKDKVNSNTEVKILISTPNIAFIIIRLMLLIGSFNYGKRGILDRTHTRLFTFSSFKHLVEQFGFSITKVHGIPAPFPLAVGNNIFGKTLIYINSLLIKISKGLFSYQIYYEIKPDTSLETLLSRANINKKN